MIPKTRKSTFPYFRSVSASLIERYIFNYRISPEELKKRLPAPWLDPQVIDGYSIVSFCILWLDKLAISPIPPIGRFGTISCAYRIGVVDNSEPVPTPSVYVTDRWADLPLIARLGPLLLQDTIPEIRAAIGHDKEGGTQVQMSFVDGSALFSASVQPSATGFESTVFTSVEGFSDFIKNGVSSYGPSLQDGQLTKVDLHKDEVDYEALTAEIEFSVLSEETWSDAGMEFDSAVRAKGKAMYKWIYRGLWSA